MSFKNEDTFSIGREKLDESFDEALEKVRDSFCRHNPLRIGGEAIFSDEEIKTVSPIDRRIVTGYFQKGHLQHARLAVQSAKDAFSEAWGDFDWRQRVAICHRAASILRRDKFEISAILSYENGKSREESVGEADEAIDFLVYYSYLMEQNAGLAIEREPHFHGHVGMELGYQGARSSGERVTIEAKPFGVWAVIAPFNFPVSISVGMCAAAIITGNTVVFKPSFGDNPAPLTGLKIYEAFEEAGLPAGVLNFITGLGSEIGDELVTNPDVRGIAFTGSRKVAADIQKKIAPSVVPKQLIAEMGSKNPVIVTGTANLSIAANGTVSAAFGFCGQKCSACSRAIVHESVYDNFLSLLTSKLQSLRVGDPLKKGNFMGPLIGEAALERYLSAMDEAKKEGKVLYGGRRLSGTELYDNGCYVEPALLEVPTESRLFRTELFLPILALVKYNDFEDALKLANNTEYGLTAGLYSGNSREIQTFNREIEYGTTYVNRAVSATTGAIVGQQTFTGCKASSMTCKGTGSLSYLFQFVREHSQTVVE
jgi:1-pyrroline-5-carboxylate dehydrogenase